MRNKIVSKDWSYFSICIQKQNFISSIDLAMVFTSHGWNLRASKLLLALTISLPRRGISSSVCHTPHYGNHWRKGEQFQEIAELHSWLCSQMIWGLRGLCSRMHQQLPLALPTAEPNLRRYSSTTIWKQSYRCLLSSLLSKAFAIVMLLKSRLYSTMHLLFIACCRVALDK